MTSDFVEQFIERCDDEDLPSIVMIPCGNDSWRVVMSFGESSARSTFHIPANAVMGLTDIIIQKAIHKG